MDGACGMGELPERTLTLKIGTERDGKLVIEVTEYQVRRSVDVLGSEEELLWMRGEEKHCG